ncbi:MAG: SpoVG family protein, partial [Oscillospiraceae bacterium]|nr:SpoVG family protein [Oscillospiraceae bacterium]
MDNRQALYSIEQGDDIRYYKAAKEYSIGDILKTANDAAPYAKLMEMGDRISIDEYADIQQSDKFTFSVEINFDTGKAEVYTVNGGKGGIAEDDRTDENISFISGELLSVISQISNPYNETNFKIQPTDNNTYVVKSDSKRFGNDEIVFESATRDECVAYVSQRKPPLDWKPYVIEDLRSWADPSAVPKRSEIEYFDTIEGALKRFNELRNMPYNAEKALNTQTGQPMARLTLGMSTSSLAVDILHVRDNKNYLVQDFTSMPEMNTDRNFLDTLAKVTAEVGFERIIAHQRDENTGKYIGEPKDLPLNEWENPYFKEGTQMDYIIQSIRVEKAVKPQVEKAFAAERGERKNTMSNTMVEHMTTRDFKSFFGNENAKKIAALAETNGITLEVHRYQEAYEERDPDRGHFYHIVGRCNTDKPHSFTLSGNFRENSEGLKEFQPIPSIIKELNRKIEKIASGEDNIVKSANSDPQQISFILNKINGFVTALEDYQKAKNVDLSVKDNALSSAKRGEREDIMINTKIECTGMVMLAEGSKAKAVATVTVNDEFVLKGIKVFEGENGLFAAMPSRKVGNDYQEVMFPITKEAREQLNNAVLESYGRLVESGLDKLPFEERNVPEQSVSKITVSLHQVDDEKTKAVGQIVIDDNIVIAGVKVRHGTNAKGEEKDFVSMPSYQTQTGDYNEYAHAVTKECYEKINKAVMGAYETLCKTEYKGVKLSELGGKGEVSSKYGMNNTFAEKLMAELEKKGIPYSARVAETTALSVKNSDRAAVDSIQ